MKTGIIMLLLACVLIGSGCKKEDESKIPKWSKITALKDGEPWEAKGFAYMDNDGNLGIAGEDWVSFTSMGIRHLPLEIGNHAELLRWSYSYGIADICALYHADISTDNFFEIKNIDLGNMEISGIFKVSFNRLFPSGEYYPPEISFTDGNFRLKIMRHEDH